MDNENQSTRVARFSILTMSITELIFMRTFSFRYADVYVSHVAASIVWLCVSIGWMRVYYVLASNRTQLPSHMQ